MLRYLTSGESHGPCLVTVLDGMPAGLAVDAGKVNVDLCRRMMGYGRGKRMRIESDRVEILSGLRRGTTIGSPVALMIKNADSSIDSLPVVVQPRPGHADLTGILKYGLRDARDVLERASARETAARVSVGSLARILLGEFGIKIASHVTIIGGARSALRGLKFAELLAVAEKSPVRCADLKATVRMCAAIDAAAAQGDTLGGVFEVIVHGCPPGLGSYVQWDRHLDGNIARAILSIQAVKAVSFGIGFEAAMRQGSAVHDGIVYDRKRGYRRTSNNAGGIEGGMSNGEDIIIQAVMKPIATLRKPLPSVNIRTKKPVAATVERSDVCAVPAAGVIGEAVTAIEIANAMIEKFGGDSVAEMKRNYDGYLKQVKNA